MKILEILLRHRSLPGHIQAVYVQNIMKLFTRIVTGMLEKSIVSEVVEICDLLLKKLPIFVSSNHIEVQERASSAYALVELLREQFDDSVTDMLSEAPTQNFSVDAIEIIEEMAILFAGDLNPVAPKAQRKVPIPDGLDLDAWINPPPEDSSSSSDDEQGDLFVTEENEQKEKIVDLSPGEVQRIREARQFEQSHNPNYLKTTKNSKSKSSDVSPDSVNDIPIAELALDVPLKVTSNFNAFSVLIDSCFHSKVIFGFQQRRRSDRINIL